MTLAALRSDAAIGQKLTLAGPQAYTVSEVIALCERFANADADVTEVCCRGSRSTPCPSTACHACGSSLTRGRLYCLCVSSGSVHGVQPLGILETVPLYLTQACHRLLCSRCASLQSVRKMGTL